uniref:Uncharacterized protein n=1 Tax=Plectus sambesii TaxID=2011161 RepID=A0A914WSR2_9BILA
MTAVVAQWKTSDCSPHSISGVAWTQSDRAGGFLFARCSPMRVGWVAMRSLPIHPEEMRLFEPGARESPYASRSPSPTCQNVTNHFEDLCFRTHYVSSANLKSAYLLVSLAIYSFLTAASLVFVEWLAADVADSKDEEEDARRSEFLRRFARFQYYLPVGSPEWAASTKDLLAWYELQLYGDDAAEPKWNLSSALAFVGAVGSTIGRLPGLPTGRLSNVGRLLLLLWSPLAIFLYYYCVWSTGKLYDRLPGRWRTTVAISLLFTVAAFVFTELLRSSLHLCSVVAAFDVFSTIGTRSDSCRQDRLPSAFISLLLHFFVWTCAVAFARRVSNWKRSVYVRVAALLPIDELLCLSSEPAKYLLQLFARGSLKARVQSILISKTDLQYINQLVAWICGKRRSRSVQTEGE